MKILLLRILCSILGAGIIKGLLYEYNIDLIPLYICMVCGSFTMTILIVDGVVKWKLIKYIMGIVLI